MFQTCFFVLQMQLSPPSISPSLSLSLLLYLSLLSSYFSFLLIFLSPFSLSLSLSLSFSLPLKLYFLSDFFPTLFSETSSSSRSLIYLSSVTRPTFCFPPLFSISSFSLFFSLPFYFRSLSFFSLPCLCPHFLFPFSLVFVLPSSPLSSVLIDIFLSFHSESYSYAQKQKKNAPSFPHNDALRPTECLFPSIFLSFSLSLFLSFSFSLPLSLSLFFLLSLHTHVLF
ncbi:unnamed protein product [Acanthosepion pharaonis]|uniref:Uncharacterized protein n=1 Tax=Acanthosepion pharaonis TaxID=158019 RepID=A0A812CBQ7_ACAPH|nr:unnamed protein product [Sepia pharaonis]